MDAFFGQSARPLARPQAEKECLVEKKKIGTEGFRRSFMPCLSQHKNRTRSILLD